MAWWPNTPEEHPNGCDKKELLPYEEAYEKYKDDWTQSGYDGYTDDDLRQMFFLGVEYLAARIKRDIPMDDFMTKVIKNEL